MGHNGYHFFISLGDDNMWKNRDTLETITDEEMEVIIQSYPCYVSNFGRVVSCNNVSWEYMDGADDVLYY